MRIRLLFDGERGYEEPLGIDQDFRRSIISAIKSITTKAYLGSRYILDRPGYAPFGCSVEFSKILGFERQFKRMLIRPPLIMMLSSGDFQIFTELCNGAIQAKNKLTVLGMTLREVTLLPEPARFSPRVCFETIGHMVLPGKQGYVGVNEAVIEEAINFHLFNRASFYRDTWNINIPNLQPVSLIETHNLHKGVCYHYGGYLTTLRGRFVLEGIQESLQFLYDYGIGSRTGQAFGLVKVVEDN